jgi:hypothetical protein
MRISTSNEHSQRLVHNKTYYEYRHLRFKLQNGKCFLCPRIFLTEYYDVCVGHDHKKKLYRGIVCRSCNTRIRLEENGIKPLTLEVKNYLAIDWENNDTK